MSEPYTEEDKLNYLIEKDANFRKLLVVFDLELDFTRKPPVKQRET